MTSKHKILYLFLTLACFIGIILIFVFDGYMGVYDTLVMDNGQFQQKVETDQWGSDGYGGMATISMDPGGSVKFTYTVENHRFSEYKSDLQIAMYYQQDKVADILSDTLAVKAFKNGETTWTLDAAKIVPADFPSGQAYNAYIILKRGDIERRIYVYVNPSYPTKVIPVPAPQ